MIDDLYHEALLEEMQQPFGKGDLEQPQHVQPGINPSCGDGVKLFMTLDDQNQQIVDFSWQGHGCAISQAAMSKVARLVSKHPQVDTILALTRQDVLTALGLEEISIGREKCLQLGLHTLQTALKEIQKKV